MGNEPSSMESILMEQGMKEARAKKITTETAVMMKHAPLLKLETYGPKLQTMFEKDVPGMMNAVIHDGDYAKALRLARDPKYTTLIKQFGKHVGQFIVAVHKDMPDAHGELEALRAFRQLIGVDQIAHAFHDTFVNAVNAEIRRAKSTASSSSGAAPPLLDQLQSVKFLPKLQDIRKFLEKAKAAGNAPVASLQELKGLGSIDSSDSGILNSLWSYKWYILGVIVVIVVLILAWVFWPSASSSVSSVTSTLPNV